MTHLSEEQIESIAEYAAGTDDLELEQYCDTLLLYPNDQEALQILLEEIERNEDVYEAAMGYRTRTES